MVIARVPVVADGRVQQRIGRIVGIVRAVGRDAVAVGVAAHEILLLAVFGAGGHGDRTCPGIERLAGDVKAEHVLLLHRVLARTGRRLDVGHRGRVGRHVADDVERPAARGRRHRIAADDGAVGRAHGVDRGVVALVQRHVIDHDADLVLAVLGVGVVLPVLAERGEAAVGAEHDPLLGSGRLHQDVFREHRVRRAVGEALDVIGGAGRHDRGRQERVVALDGQVVVLGRTRIRIEGRADPRQVEREIDLVVGVKIVADPGVRDLAAHVHAQGGAGADAAGQVAPDAEWIVTTGHRAGAGRHAVRAILELVRLAARTESGALQRAARNQAVFGVLVLLGVLDHRVLRLAVIGLGQGANLVGGVIEPGASIAAAFAEAWRRHPFLAAVFAADRHVQLVVQEALAPGRLHGAVLVVAVGGLAAFDVGLEAVEPLVRDEVDHAAHRVRAIGRRGAAGDDVDPLDQQLRELAHVRHAGHVGADHALAVEQGQGADRAQAAQAQ